VTIDKKSPILSVRLGSDLKKRWDDYCEKIGTAPSTAIKAAITQQLTQAQQTKQPKTYRQIRERPADEPKTRFEILLTQSEKQAIQERADFEQCSMRRWIVDACRASLTREPQFSMKEIEALGESNYLLLALGRNLNQIARRLNEGKREEVTVERIKDLSALIDAHTEVVSTAIRASLERWRLE